MLQTIDLSTNKFSRTVPPVFGGMNGLFRLNLERNQFQASDAKDLSFIDSLVNCSNLQGFSIANNDLGGVLPLSLANFSKELRFLFLDYNHFLGIIPRGIENLISLNLMNFGGNDLTGQIPEHIGNIPMLQRLSFADNKLTGYIPSSIGNLTQIMEVIDPSVFSQEQEDDDIEHEDILSVRKKIEYCLVSVVALGLACSVETPNERLGMNDVAAQMHAIRDKFVEFRVHGVKQEVSPAKLTIP
ncbi:hypothetical protein J5N97_028165 [Dioscorea zingiberensis]|uniref:Uncharacterized protein n=1 Tax=Dioscorea zingiberensis TaxID=325984 RepID=A0A9D5BYF1_9LILI|nr:hypothetical protein J5N97_028165 [Dioscorea zingiberensis]